jgi:outer membrane immunogenic protein
MRTWGLIPVLLVCGGLGAAGAADLRMPTKAGQAPAAGLTGCYVGGHAGAAVTEDRMTGFSGNSTNFSAAGAVVGGQIGCDYSFAPDWVVGVEGRAAWSSLKKTRAAAVIFQGLGGLTVPSQISLRNDFLASATARVGYRFAGQWLVFARGGAAWTREKQDEAFISPLGIAVDPRLTTTRTGWTVGSGVDYSFAPHWSVVLEYNYYDFGSHGALLTSRSNPTTVSISSLKDTISESSVGVNYHF